MDTINIKALSINGLSEEKKSDSPVSESRLTRETLEAHKKTSSLFKHFKHYYSGGYGLAIARMFQSPQIEAVIYTVGSNGKPLDQLEAFLKEAKEAEIEDLALAQSTYQIGLNMLSMAEKAPGTTVSYINYCLVK